AEIEKLKTRLQARYSDAVADVLQRREEERQSLGEELARARQEAASPLGEAWGECRSLLDALEAAPDAEEARVRLRAALRRIVEGFWCLFAGRGRARLAGVQVWSTGGRHRDYLILHRPPVRGAAANRPGEWWVRSLAGAAGVPASLDFRKPADVRRLEQALEAVDVSGAA